MSGAPSPDTGPISGGPGQAILVVEDDRLVREVLRILLTRAGYDVTIATDGAEGIACFEAACPDLMIVDVRMPVIDGFGVLAHVRSHGRTPVIMLSAEPELFHRAAAVGADACLRKPFVNDELVARVAEMLGQ